MESDAAATVTPSSRPLGKAVLTALILVALLVGSVLLGRTAFFVLVCAVVLLAQFELYDMLLQVGRKPVMPFGLACGFAMLVVAYLERPAFLAAVLGAAAFGSMALALRPDRGALPAGDVAWTLLGVAWIGGGGAGAVSILMLPGGRLLLVAFVVVIALADIGGYFVGTERGTHKLAPSISPAKSWEGFAAGYVCALAAGALAAGVLFRLSLLEGLGLGAICGLFGPIGDLVESIVKREIGIKDSGRLLPGHGGMLDRLDAIVFCAPAAFVYLRFIVF